MNYSENLAGLKIDVQAGDKLRRQLMKTNR